MEFAYLILFISVNLSLANRRLLKVEKAQTDGTLDGLGCAIDDPMLQSGGEFDLQTRTCTKLPREWFSNIKFEPGRNYFKLVSLENIGLKNLSFDEDIPLISFGVPNGGSIVMYVKSTDYPKWGHGKIEFRSFGGKRLMVQDMMGEIWQYKAADGGNRENTNSPISDSNRAYRLDFYINILYVNILIDVKIYHSFQHQFDKSLYQRFTFSANNPYPAFLCESPPEIDQWWKKNIVFQSKIKGLLVPRASVRLTSELAFWLFSTIPDVNVRLKVYLGNIVEKK